MLTRVRSVLIVFNCCVKKIYGYRLMVNYPMSPNQPNPTHPPLPPQAPPASP